MTRVILITFGFLGWAWFELSGGSEFEPGENGVAVLARYEPPQVETVELVPAEPEQVVARADTLEAPLTRVAQPRIIVKPAPSFVEEAKVETVAAQDEPLGTTLVIGGLNGDLSNLGQPIAVGQNDPVATAISAAVDYRVVSGSRVNLRSGPSTEFAVVTSLVRGNEVEVLQDDGLGWVKLRALNGNDIGWMSDSFLVASD